MIKKMKKMRKMKKIKQITVKVMMRQSNNFCEAKTKSRNTTEN